jgi:hypothetical protein
METEVFQFLKDVRELQCRKDEGEDLTQMVQARGRSLVLGADSRWVWGQQMGVHWAWEDQMGVH